MILSLWLGVGLLAIDVRSVRAGEAAQRLDRLLSEAQEAFDRGAKSARDDVAREHFETAIRKYEALVDGGVRNGRLFYNLGNAYFRIGRTGQAVLNYLRAVRLEPTDPKIRANLRYARSRTVDQLGSVESGRPLAGLLFWHYEWGQLTKARAAAVVYVLAWALMLLREFHRRRYWLGLAVALWLAAGCLAGSIWLYDVESRAHPIGVITAESVEARKGSAASFAKAFDQPLHAGTEFLQLSRQSDWLEVQLPNGRSAWLPADAVRMVGDLPAAAATP